MKVLGKVSRGVFGKSKNKRGHDLTPGVSCKISLT